MKFVIKAKACEQLPDGNVSLTLNVEDFKAMLQSHSPNILIDYLNEQYNMGITPIKQKGGAQ